MSIIREGDIDIRRMLDRDEDYRLLVGWFADPALKEWYGGRDIEWTEDTVRKKFSVRMMDKSRVTACIIQVRGTPVGYLQYYPIEQAEKKSSYGIEDPSVYYGLDLFIGSPKGWGAGLGTRVLLLIQKYLFDDLYVDKITLDPDVNNARAIRCYEKAGFKKLRQMPQHQTHEGRKHDCWLMVAENPVPQTDIKPKGAPPAHS